MCRLRTQRTERLFHDASGREFQGIARRANRRLEALHAAARLEDLRVPPSTRLEKLRGDLHGFHSLRINDQGRIVSRGADNNGYAVSRGDYP
ncbi:MAG: type II toxin-antitoxin system RelE/ParE family toxin [Candidatus Methylomirabilales bacterium]